MNPTTTVKAWAPNANGHFVFEAESAIDQDVSGGWAFHTTADLPAGHTAPTGGGYIEATADSFGAPKDPDLNPNSLLTYTFIPEEDGFVRINLVASHQGIATEENDTWTGVLDKDGNPINAITQGGSTLEKKGELELYKTFSSGGTGGQWVTANKNIDNVGKAIVVPVKGGELHEFVLMERSADHEIDRIVLEFSPTPFTTVNSNTSSHINQPLSQQVDVEVPVEPGGNVGAATLGVTLGSNNVQSSNFGDNSFVITNVGDKQIASIEIDVTDALYGDAVFDPFGVAGDSTAKQLTINTAGNTGVQPVTSSTYIGEGGIKGFEGIKLNFTNFDGGETLGFSVDMDPNSIAGSTKSTLDGGSQPSWDVGGISGAELIGSTFTVTFEDGTTATGQLQSNKTQAGAQALASQEITTPQEVTLTVNGFGAGGVGSYNAAPTVIVNGPAGETARIVLTKGVIQPENNNFTGAYAEQLQAQLDALAASPFPANNAAEFQFVDVVLTGANQDITALFNFTEVPNSGFAMDEDKFPLGFVASVIDPENSGLPKGPVTAPIYLTHTESLLPIVTVSAPAPQAEAGDSGTTAVVFTAAISDPAFTGTVDVTYEETVNGSTVEKTATLDFSGAAAPTITVAVPNDNSGNGDDTVSVKLLATTSADVTVGTAAATATVTEDDGGAVEGAVLLRINAFGPEIAATDGGPNWVVDTPFYSAVDNRGDTLGTATAGDTGAPDELFQGTRSSNGTMNFTIDADTHLNGDGTYKVKLFFTEPFFASADSRVFDTSIEGVVPENLDNLDPAATTPKGVGFVVENIVEVTDGVLNIALLTGAESGAGGKQNPVISGIEIVEMVTEPTATEISVEPAADVVENGDTGTTAVTFDLSASDPAFSGVVELLYEETVGGTTTQKTATVDFGAAGTPTLTVEVANDGADNGPEDVSVRLLSVADPDLAVDGTAQTASVTEDDADLTQVAGGSATIGITKNGGLDASTFDGSAFTISNESAAGVTIEKVIFDLSSGILPDMVFDPLGTGGDAVAKALQVSAGGAATGFVAPASTTAPFSQARNGGWDVMELNFTDFDAGETIAFSVDVDPNSIQDGSGSGAAGAVSGAELIGAKVTVVFTDGTSTETTVGSLFENGTLGGGVSLNSTGDAPAAPTVALAAGNIDEVASLPGQQTTVAGPNHTVVVTGAVGAIVHLVQLDGRLLENASVPPYDVTDAELPFYANELMAGKEVYTATIGADGTATFEVSMLESAGTPAGGVNHFMAVLEDPSTGARSTASAPLVLIEGDPLTLENVDHPAAAEALAFANSLKSGVTETIGLSGDLLTVLHTDAEDEYAGWLTIERVYGLDGLLNSTTTAANGDTTELTYSADGVLERRVDTDVAEDTPAWATRTFEYDADGNEVKYTLVRDDDSQSIRTTAPDGSTTLTLLDGPLDTKGYQERVVEQDADGTITRTFTRFDNGDTDEVLFGPDGSTRTLTDVGGDSPYAVNTIVTDADGNRLSDQRVYDSGDILSRDFEPGGGFTEVYEDVSDARNWDTRTRVFDETGKLIDGPTFVFDDPIV